ncbi:hypothetical protein FZ103_08180 [Streptomonospora sp. PA3]|uniref:hypothetical protein n=1 Tax=Streptomonospora sp. PA3 TaxID=2607326 RepID=UPI0012DCF623|nr:hypothetical protein [Streptomonospora sp. PA3]MUL41157.1 hypothetical protein [Streptomonospora sp. PA3]
MGATIPGAGVPAMAAAPAAAEDAVTGVLGLLVQWGPTVVVLGLVIVVGLIVWAAATRRPRRGAHRGGHDWAAYRGSGGGGFGVGFVDGGGAAGGDGGGGGGGGGDGGGGGGC